MSYQKVSVVIAALNEGDNLRDTVNCILLNSRYPSLEIVVVDDGSIDGSGQRAKEAFGDYEQVIVLRTDNLGVAGARNHGAAAASGEVLVFLDGHCYTPPGWIETLIEPLNDPQIGMVGPALASLSDIHGARGYGAMWRVPSLEIDWLPCQGDRPYDVPLHPGGCQAVRRTDFDAIGGYDPGMGRWGSEGEELSLRYWMLGYNVVVQPLAVIHHLFRKRHPYHVDSPQIIHNRIRMALMHFGTKRIEALLDHYGRIAGFSQIVLALIESDVSERRDYYQRCRQKDDDWFFARFAPVGHVPGKSKRLPIRPISSSGGSQGHFKFGPARRTARKVS